MGRWAEPTTEVVPRTVCGLGRRRRSATRFASLDTLVLTPLHFPPLDFVSSQPTRGSIRGWRDGKLCQ